MCIISTFLNTQLPLIWSKMLNFASDKIIANMTTPISNNFETHIINELMLAQQSIKIAVAWFNSKNILEILCWKLRGGVNVEMILHYDEVNSGSESSLDFSEYKQLGGVLIWAKGEKSTMHVKFCIIDEKVLLHGSCNWTYRAFNKNDEVLNITTDEPEMISSYLFSFSSLVKKYTLPTPVKNMRHEIQTRKKVTKEERIRLFVEEMNRFDIKNYRSDYIKSFLEYWTEDATASKMRFENKANFVMMLELEDWGKMYKQIKEDKEYECFYQSVQKETYAAYHQYCNYIDEKSPWPDFTERLKQMNDDIEAKAELLKQTRLIDVFPNWSEKRGKSTVYDYLINHNLPMIKTTSELSGFIQYNDFQYGVYSYRKKEPHIEKGLPHDNYSSWWNLRGLSTIKQLEDYFECSFLEYVQVPARMLCPSFKTYSKHYIESCIFYSRFRFKLKNSYSDKMMTKERLCLLLEAAHAIDDYNKRMKDYIDNYGHLLIGDVLNGDDFSSIKDIHVDDYLSTCFLELSIDYNYHYTPRELFVHYNINVWGSKRLQSKVIVPRINEALNINIEFPIEITDSMWGVTSYYILSDDIYYAREDFRFLSLEESCGFDIKKWKLSQ